MHMTFRFILIYSPLNFISGDLLLVVVISLLECLITQHQSIGAVAYDQVYIIVFPFVTDIQSCGWRYRPGCLKSPVSPKHVI